LASIVEPSSWPRAVRVETQWLGILDALCVSHSYVRCKIAQGQGSPCRWALRGMIAQYEILPGGLIPQARKAFVARQNRKDVKDRRRGRAPGQGGPQRLCHGAEFEACALGIGPYDGLGGRRIPIGN